MDCAPCFNAGRVPQQLDEKASEAVSVAVKRVEPGSISAPSGDGHGNERAEHSPVIRAGVIRDGLSDVALVSASGHGESAAFRCLVERHLPFVLAVAGRMLRSSFEADDIAQEAFLRLWRNIPGLAADGRGVKAWLRRVTANLCIDRMRAGRSTIVTDKPPEQAVAPDQITRLNQGELARRVAEALHELPHRQHLALVLFHYEGLSQRDVAEAMSISQDAVESLLARARRSLKTSLRDEWRQLLLEEEA